MMQQLSENYLLPESVEITALLKQLGKKFRTEQTAENQGKITYCDSFDWRLFAKGFLLKYSGTAWTLLKLVPEKIVVTENGSRPGKKKFPWEFATGPLRSTLEEILTIRSLLPLAEMVVSTWEVRILNKDEKTVVWLIIERHQMEGMQEDIQVVRVEAVRGYLEEFQNVTKFFRKFENVEQPISLVVLKKCLAGNNTFPGDYSSKLKLNLDPDQTARSATVHIYQTLLASIYNNISGTIDDLDSEFLHDLRVAVRRTRSALSLIKNVLPPEIVEQYKVDFAYIGKVTGPVRDLDVYLLDEERYKKQLPEFLQEGLHSFFEGLAIQRNIEQKLLVKELKGSQVLNTLSSWEDYLGSDDKIPAKFADVPVIDVAKKVITGRYKRVMKDGLAITSITPDEEIHRLRIQGKKLRYAMEFFSSLFSDKEITKAIKTLKQLQNYLGDFNDLSVQQGMLREHLTQIRPGSRKNQMLSAALGGLLANLYQKQLKSRGEFAVVFSCFSGQANRELFESLFT